MQNTQKLPIIHGEKRALLQRKRKSAPVGGGFGAASARARVNRNYQGIPPEELPKIDIQIRKSSRNSKYNHKA